MDKQELNKIKETYNEAGYFMLYVDEVGFEPKLLSKLMKNDIYTINDFEEKFIKENYAETEDIISELKAYLIAIIKDMSHGVLSAESKSFDEILEAFSELLKADKVALQNLSPEKFAKADLLKTLISRHYRILGEANSTENEAFVKYIDEKYKAFVSSNKN